jgi:uncharacterized C2H2 Zn-finger protein
MRQTNLDEYTQKEKLVCDRCNRLFKSAKALNIHISKRHTGDKLPPLYVGEGIKDIQSEGRYVDLRIRIKRSLWDSIKRAALSERIKPDEAIIASLVNLTVHGTRAEEPTYIS